MAQRARRGEGGRFGARGLLYTIVAAFMRQTTRPAPSGEARDGQALHLSQEQAGEEEGK